jgi:hypothetical protein
MRNSGAAVDLRAEAARGFEAVADMIMYRWAVERDTWVSTREVDQARAYLERAGVDLGRLPHAAATAGEITNTLEASRVVLLGLRHLHVARRRGRD